MSFSINEVQIDNVSSFKFLGIMLNEHLTWKAHANMITIKLSKVVGIINKFIKSSWNNKQIKVCLSGSCSDDSVYFTEHSYRT